MKKRIKELEAKLPTKEEAELIKRALHECCIKTIEDVELKEELLKKVETWLK